MDKGLCEAQVWCRDVRKDEPEKEGTVKCLRIDTTYILNKKEKQWTYRSYKDTVIYRKHSS